MNQSGTINDLRKNGWQLGHRGRDGFVHMYKKDRTPYALDWCREYYEITVFKNGRYCHGDYSEGARLRRKYKKV